MVISEEQNRELYITVSNSFSGKFKKKGDRYLSTHKGGNGIGLISIAATATSSFRAVTASGHFGKLTLCQQKKSISLLFISP